MKIVCPNCSTTYEVGATSIAPEGRDVRCSRCGTTWHIGGETAEPAPTAPAEDDWAAAEEAEADTGAGATVDDELGDDWASAMAAEEAPPKTEDGESDWAFSGAEEEPRQPKGDDDWQSEIGLIDGPDGDADEATAAPAKDPVVRRRPRKKPARRTARYRVSPQMRAGMGLALFAASIVLCIAMITLREPIVRAAPTLANLYAHIGLEVNLRGLEFRDLRTFREYDKGAPVLIVEGMIENIRKSSASVPAIRLALRSSDAQEIYAWSIEPRQLRLRAGQTLRFSTRLASPPDVAADVFLRFAERSKRPTDL